MKNLKLTNYRPHSTELKAVVRKVIEIIDWINAQDKCNAQVGDMIKAVCPGEPSIEQELELELNVNHIPDGDGGWVRCTRIFLPAAKYEEYIKSLPKENAAFLPYIKRFHDIPVFSWPEDYIHYCTD